MVNRGLQAATGARAVRTTVPRAAAVRCGEWQLLEEVGRGVWTSVFRARPVNSPVTQPAGYAVKLPAADKAEDPRVVSMLCREARAARHLAHDHIVPILGASLNRPPYYLAMPLLPGQTLEAELRTRRLPLATALWLARQAAEALMAMHAAGWLHGDLKPSNLMVAPNGHLTIIDLGLARARDEFPDVTREVVVGTPNYLPPEALVPGSPLTSSADVYSLGVTLFEMVAGHRPHSVEEVDLLGDRLRRIHPPSARRFACGPPIRLTRLIRQMIANQPLRRPAAEEAVERLVSLEIEAFSER